MAIAVPALQQYDISRSLSSHAAGLQNKFQMDDRQRAFDDQAQAAIIRAAELADTPEKWATFIDTIGGQFPQADLSAFRDFSSREAAIAQSMDPYQRAQLDLSRQQLELQRQAAARAAASAGRTTPYSQLAQIQADVSNGYLTQEQADALMASMLRPDDPNPYTDAAKINADLNAGLITPDQANAQLAALGGGMEAPDVVNGIGPNGETVQLVFDPTNANANEFGFVQMGGARPPSGLVISMPDGTVIDTRGGSVDNGDIGSAEMALRMAGANDVIDQLGGTVGVTLSADILSNLGTLGNMFSSPEQRQFAAASRAFVYGQLRKESGAAITPQEMAEMSQYYLPAPNDDPATLAYKAQNRAIAIAAMEAEAGAALSQVQNQLPQAPDPPPPPPTPDAPASPTSQGVPPTPETNPEDLTYENILTTMQQWQQAGYSATAAWQAIANQYGITVDEVRRILGL